MLQSPIVVSTIANDIEIRALFRSRYWEVDDGIDVLLGIYSVEKEDDGNLKVQTLDGKVYAGPENANLVDDLLSRHDILRKIWVNSIDAEKASKSFFIRWGLKHKDICGLFWIEDALTNGLLPAKILESKNQQTVESTVEKPLEASERNCLLRIIAALTVISYERPFDDKGKLKWGLMAQIRKDMLEKEFNIDEETVNKHLKAAWSKNFENLS